MQLFTRFRKRSITFKVVSITLFIVFFINNIVYLIQPFEANTIFEYYTLGYFSLTSSLQHIVFGIFPFSFGDILYLLIALILILEIFSFTYSLIFFDLQKLINAAGNALLLLLFIWFLLGSQWNWNYYQPSLESKLKLDTTDYTVNELADFTKEIIEKTTQNKNNSNFNIFTESTSSILDISHLGYSELEKKDSFFNYQNPSIKYSLFSSILPYLGISGYYNPFTAEAQITEEIPIVQIPFVVNHEIAHQLGIASEAEANFIGYIASIKNPLSTIKYSGYVNLLMYCLADLKYREYNDYNNLVATIPKNVKTDINEIYAFWKSYQNKYKKHFNKGYDKFLKSNNQKDGMKSYNKVVSLAIFYNRKHQ
jgi:uncharacterized protein YjfI (DUF2170 family)